METTVIAQIMIYGVLTGSVYALVALGLSLIFGVMKILSFVHGAYTVLAAYVTYWLFIIYGLDPFLSIIALVVIFFLIGYSSHELLIRPLLETERFSDSTLLVTFGAMLVLQNMMIALWSVDPRSVNPSYRSVNFLLGGVTFQLVYLAAFIVTLVSSGSLYLFLFKTRTGKAMRATAQQSDLARLTGVNTKRMFAFSFGIATALAGVAGTQISLLTVFEPQFGLSLLIKAFCVILVGGMGGIMGPMIGGLLLGITESTIALVGATQWSNAVAYIFIFVAVFVRAYLKRT